MENHDIEIEIGRDGKVKVHVKGVKGSGCLKYAEFLEQVIGRMDSREFTSEYYEPDSGVQVQPLIHRRERG